MQTKTNLGTASAAMLLAGAVGLAGCPPVDPLGVNDVDPIGSLTGSFSCVIDAPDESRFDLGFAALAGELESTEFIAGLRTQGCLARTVETARGDAVSVTLIQQTRFDRAQVLELVFPVSLLAAPQDSPLVVDDTVVVAGNGAFGSMYVLDPGEDPNLFARTAGGGVLLSAWGSEEGAEIAGSFDALRMGAL